MVAQHLKSPTQSQAFLQGYLEVFGVQTSTDDLEGDAISRQSAQALGLAQIKLQLPTFIGNIMQVPPKFSAIQIDGKRQYQLARKGVAVDIPARSVN